MNMIGNPLYFPDSYQAQYFPRDAVEQSITSRFEQQVELYPDRLAIANADLSLTYNELNRLANRIARAISAVEPDKRALQVAIYMEKGIQHIAAILGTLKAGHTYVPIDPSFPSSRNNYIIANSCASIALTNTVNAVEAEKLISESVTLINLDDIEERLPDTNLNLDISPDTLAYIIYTSGSTGRPKGVMQNHRNTLHGCMRRTNLQQITPEDRMTLFYSCSVMGSVYCIFGALLNGASLFPYDIREEGLDELAEWLEFRKITIYHSVASVFRQFATGYTGPTDCFAVRLVIFGGERVLASDIELARKVFSRDVHFFTGLGSTETGTVRHFLINPDTRIDSKAVPIGYPVEDVEVVLTDDDGREVAPGEIGEIAVRSKYLALGYWNDPDNTERVFGRDAGDPDMRIYFMGDMGELNSDGLLEHRGRKDFQVKIRGFRVEIGEIETALMDHGKIGEAVVVTREIGQETQLVAYIVQDSAVGGTAGELNVRALREHLRNKLPYYMIPSMFVALNSIPRTPNNKVNRNALPQPSSSNEFIDDECVAPTNDIEQGLVDICSELLRRPHIGTNHNFFDHGGDSLSATRLIARVNERFGIRLAMRAVFEAENLKELAARIQSAAPHATAEDAKIESSGLTLIPRNGQLPVSFAQRRMWLVDQLHDGSSAYNISNSVRLKGALDIPALEKALSEMVARHEVLRTVFPSDDEGPWQEVKSAEAVILEQTDLRKLAGEARELKALEMANQVLYQKHDLANGPLFSCSLIRLRDCEFVLVLVFNHIIYDNIWSSGIFFRELGLLYETFSKNRNSISPLPPLKFQFADYAGWEQKRVNLNGFDEVVDYWKQQLSDCPEPLQLPSDTARPERPTFRGGQIKIKIPASLRLALNHIARSESSTMFMVLLAVWQLLLHRYTQQDDILVGTPTGRRYRTETEGLIGLFINNLVIRTDFSGNPAFRELLHRVRHVTIEAFSHDELPFEKLVEELRPERSAGISPFFQHLFIHRNTSGLDWHIPGLELTPLEVHQGGAKFDLTLSVLESDHELSATLEYSRDLFKRNTVERMAANYVQLLTSAVEQPDCPVWQLELLDESERRQLTDEWNQTTTPYPANTATHQLFEEQVKKNPDAIALISDTGNLSYHELNERANQLAAHLISLGVGPEKLVGVCLSRSPDLIIALLGVLKAGGAYVPLDPFFPAERLAYMIEDSEATVFISEQAIVEKLPELNARTVLLDADSPIFASEHTGNPNIEVDPENLVYVIYTSGSTGQPKGVQLKQNALVNFLCSMQKEPGITANDVLLSLTTICFDIAALEVFLPLISGASVVIKPREASLTPENLIESIYTHGVTIMQATPVTWRMLLDHGGVDIKIKALCGGEAMGDDLAEKLLQAGFDVWNLYGPTETTIWSSVCNVKQKSDAAIIGHPIANTEFLICNSMLTLQPIGVPGELIIGGDGLARGYFHREEITREKFIPHPFAKGKTVYRTGDLVVRRPNGDIEFLGRIDNQVKIRGFRIELGDIESHIANYPDIKQAVVIAREDAPGDKTLVGYMVSKSETEINVDKLRTHLRKQLPEYMVPSAFITLPEFPLTPNNKVDRKKLPAPTKKASPVTETIPSTDTTVSQIVEIFEEVLGAPVTSLQKSFFDLGGHSLSALTTVAKINRIFSINLPQTILFDLQTVEQLSKAIITLRKGSVKAEDLKVPALSKKDAEQVERITSVLKAIPDLATQYKGEACPTMNESWFCKNILAPLYPRCRASLRKIMTRVILKLEGGTTFTVTMRKLFRQCYDIDIGNFTSVTFDVSNLRRTTRVGKYCSIFRTAFIQNADHPRNTLSTHAMFYHKQFGFTKGYELDRVQVEIGNDVWIGADAKILYPTRKIGDGAVIASGAVVVEDVPPYAIVGGYPAQVIRYRFSRETIAKLMEVKWWDYSLKELQTVKEEFMKPVEGDRIR